MKDALDTIARLSSTQRLHVDFRIEYGLFQALSNQGADQIDRVKVGLASLSKGSKQTLAKMLRDILVQADATYVVQGSEQGSEIVVVPDRLDFGNPRWANFLGVSTHLEKKPLNEALEELSDLTGVSVVLDGAVGDKAKTAVTATLKNVPLPAAVRVLSNMADLKPVVIDNVLYVTTKEKAQALIDDSAAEALPLTSRSGGAAGA